MASPTKPAVFRSLGPQRSALVPVSVPVSMLVAALVSMLSACAGGNEPCAALADWADQCGASEDLAERVLRCEQEIDAAGGTCVDFWADHLACMRREGCVESALACPEPIEAPECN